MIEWDYAKMHGMIDLIEVDEKCMCAACRFHRDNQDDVGILLSRADIHDALPRFLSKRRN